MQQSLITREYEQQLQQEQQKSLMNFRDCWKASEGNGLYQKKLFWLMATYWITASFFIALPFFLFKKPIYCQSIYDESSCCDEGDIDCVNQICQQFSSQIKYHVKQETSLTYLFGLFCDKDWIRVMYKVFPQTLCLIGFLVYGSLADQKGRKITVKISWRLYAVGIIIFSTAQAQLLKSFGYVLASIHCLPSLVNLFILFFQHNTVKQKNRVSLYLLACLFVGPLVLSLIEEFLYNQDNRIILGVFCALPAVVLSVLINKIYESPVCVYPYNKQTAFQIVNLIAKQNKQLPIMIDLSRTLWHKNIIPDSSFIALLKRGSINAKLILGAAFMFVTIFNVKLSQVSLDFYTSTMYRSLLVNVTTAVADLTLCFALMKFKNKSCRPMSILIVLLSISLLACNEMDFNEDTMRTITIVHSVLIRYLSQLCRGLLIIWSIEAFPTICRGYCVGFVFCGSAIGCLLVYILRDLIQTAYIISLVSTTFMIVLQGYIDIQQYPVMKDTFSNGYYDQNDYFYKG